jgi:DNA modification methylase
MTSQDNIGNLPLGPVDTIITSPPYVDLSKPGNIKRPITREEYEERKRRGDHSVYHDVRPERKGTLYEYYEIIPIEKYGGKENIDQLPLGNIDAVITSPPYTNAAAENPNILELQRKGWVKGGDMAKFLPSNLSEENIGKLPLGRIDTIITSPPYADAKKGVADAGKMAERWDEKFREKGESWDSWGKTWRTPGRMKGLESLGSGYSNDKSNIGNLPFGKIDTIITSPPYEGSLEGTSRHTCGGIASRDPKLAQTGTYADVVITSPPYDNAVHCRGHSEYQEKLTEEKKLFMDEYGKSNANIGNLKSSDEEYRALVDAVITSPPYAHESTASEPTKLEAEGKFKMGHSKEVPYTDEDYREWDKHVEGNIGKRKLFIRVPCSPEEAEFHDTRPERRGTIWEWTKEVLATPEVIEKIQKLKSEKKGKSETYIEAMFKVYSEMYKVLKPGGLAIIIVKPFIRNKRVVDLPYYTWIMMSSVGFKLEKLYKLRLQNQSFWRTLYYKKNPNIPRIAHEYVIVARKPSLN